MCRFLSLMFIASFCCFILCQSIPYENVTDMNYFEEENHTNLLINDYFGEDNTSIISGVVVKEERLPFMAFLTLPNKNFCGGSIVTDWHILTAAHCVAPYNPRDILVGVGSVNRRYQTQYPVAKIIIHPGFNSKVLSNGNDIALLKLARKLEMDEDRVAKIRLPPQDAPLPKILGVAGWGYTSDFLEDSQEILRGVLINVIDLCQCTKLTGLKFTSIVFCDAGDNRGACTGDSGSPIFGQDSSIGFKVQYGIVSGGLPNRCSNAPGFHTRVSAHMNWLMRASKE